MSQNRNLHKPETQYLSILRDIAKYGSPVLNERTGSKCITLLNQQIQFYGNVFPILTTKKVNWKQAINEMVCYIRGYTDLEDFHSLDVKTWDMNCNAWNSPNKRSESDTGIIYGASAKAVGKSLQDVVEGIKKYPYDRGHIWNFWNPEYFDKGCLRPCMYVHQFNVIGQSIHLTSTQRSCDFGLGSPYNMLQCWFLLNLVAKMTNYNVGTITMNLVNCHIYENQLEGVTTQLNRVEKEKPTIKGMEELPISAVFNHGFNPCDWLELENYDPHPFIKFPFTV